MCHVCSIICSVNIPCIHCATAPVISGGPSHKPGDLVTHNASESCPTKMASHHLFLVFSSFALSASSALTTDEVSQMKVMLKRTVVRGTNIPTALRLAFHDCVGRFILWKILWQNLRRWMRWLSERREPRQCGLGGSDRESGDPLPRAGLLWYHFKVHSMLYQISAHKVPTHVFDFLYIPTPNSNYQFTVLMNRADFWALAGITAVDKGIEISNEACLEDDCAVPESGLVFQWGRQVCDCNSFF